ncbi:hypothetical protein NQ317_002670 [Molorchus minor]|uniref:Uncharacterized protein n=1 Tax=Molorchus minor TaxID=1323400 RepID=A0ABQ9JXE6_9CUCU|nr:hypothetical protein NQ317_002670 [Molorchus minor]
METMKELLEYHFPGSQQINETESNERPKISTGSPQRATREDWQVAAKIFDRQNQAAFGHLTYNIRHIPYTPTKREDVLNSRLCNVLRASLALDTYPSAGETNKSNIHIETRKEWTGIGEGSKTN